MDSQGIVDKVFSSLGIAPAKPPSGTAVSGHLTIGEDKLISPDTFEFYMIPEEVKLFEAARELYGRPVRVNAGFRTVAWERVLAAQGNYTAKLLSFHCLGAALDCQPSDVDLFRDCVARGAESLGYERPRMGWHAYKDRILHFDLGFMLFAPYTALAHPSTWPELDDKQRAAMGAVRPGVVW